METLEAKLIIESLLFVSQEPVPVDRLSKILELSEGKVEKALGELATEYRDRGLRLQRADGAVQLVSAPEAGTFIEKFLGLQPDGRLSTAALETLAVVAYRQPITRAAVEAARGVNSDRALSTLQARGLIAEVGRLETVGRPVLFGTTFEFLQQVGLERIDDLPPLPAGSEPSASSLPIEVKVERLPS
ncbi:MAG: SMC-Scp complex subunit ScpB [Chloroflexota bacterium]|nr:MAG: SMC-Scp complex subunit ScpB [Chloroflexota bacterium]